MWDAKKCVASVQETYNGFIFKIKPHNLTKWNKFHWHCQKKKKKKGAKSHQATQPGQNSMKDLDDVIKAMLIKLNMT